MNTNRLYYGDIELIKTRKQKYIGDIYTDNGKIELIETYNIPKQIVPYKSKVVLVKYPKNSYVEITKIKTLKDIIKIYYEIFFKKRRRLYVIKENNSTKHIVQGSLTKINMNEKHMNIKKNKKNIKIEASFYF